MAEETEHGFPIGRVAATLRKILSPDLTDHSIEAISVCLMSHLIVERSINQTLYRWLHLDAPLHSDEEQKKKADDALWQAIVKMDFAKKFSLIAPHFALVFPGMEKKVWKINDLRNDIFHGRALDDAKFDGQPISSEKAVEAVFLAAQEIAMNLGDFFELVDRPHAIAERWEKKLKDLGQDLY